MLFIYVVLKGKGVDKMKVMVPSGGRERGGEKSFFLYERKEKEGKRIYWWKRRNQSEFLSPSTIFHHLLFISVTQNRIIHF